MSATKLRPQEVETIISNDGITIDLVSESCDSWVWNGADDGLTEAVAEIVGPKILRETFREMFAHSEVADGKFIVGMQCLEGDVHITFDPTLLIDWWLNGNRLVGTEFSVDTDGVEECHVILTWLEAQAERMRRVIKDSTRD